MSDNRVPSRNGLAVGALCGILAAVCYGANPLGAVMLHRAGIGTGHMLMWRFAFAAMLLGGWMLVRRESFGLTRRNLMVTLLLGALFAVSSQTFYASFLLMDVGIACTLLFIYPILTALMMAVCFGERLTLATLGACALAFTGIAVLSLGGGEHRVSVEGLVLVGLSALTYALYIIVLNRSAPKLSLSALTFWVLLFCLMGVAGWTACSAGVSALTLPKGGEQWGYALFLAVVPTLLSLMFMAVSARRLGSTPTAILGALEPLTAVAVGVLVFGEALTVRLGIGTVCVLLAVGLTLLRRRV